MQGGTITSGRLCTFGVVGAYWISCISSFSKTTLPGVVARSRPTSKARSSDIEMRPFATSARNRPVPSIRAGAAALHREQQGLGVGGQPVLRARRVEHLAQRE